MSLEVSDLVSDVTCFPCVPHLTQPVSYAGGTEKKLVSWLNGQMNVITGEEIISKDL